MIYICIYQTPVLFLQTSWEPEEHLPADLIALFQQQNPQLFEQRVAAAAADVAADFVASEELWPDGDGRPETEEGYQTQFAPVSIKVSVPVAAQLTSVAS